MKCPGPTRSITEVSFTQCDTGQHSLRGIVTCCLVITDYIALLKLFVITCSEEFLAVTAFSYVGSYSACRKKSKIK